MLTLNAYLCLLLAAGQHFEEVKYLTGRIGRLKDKLGLAERDLAVAHAIKVRGQAGRMPACLRSAYIEKLLHG
jgi:hypothetical protein